MSGTIHRAMLDATYRALPGVSQSALKVIGEQSPAAYRWQRDHPQEPSPALLLGSAVDCLILEPETWDQRYVLASRWPQAPCACGAGPGQPCRNKDGSESQRCHGGRRQAEDSQGRRVIDRETHDHARAIADAVLSYDLAAVLVRSTEHQVSLEWTDEATGCPCKGRLDLARADLLGDLKTCRKGAAKASGWGRYAGGLGYDYQLAYYTDGWAACTGEVLPWVWLAVETEPPYHVALIQATSEWLEIGRQRYRKALEMWRGCRDIDVWPGYPEGVQLVAPPRWLGRDAEVDG